LDYAHEKLHHATYVLATRFEELTTRLSYAYREFMPINAEEIPATLKEDYEWIMTELHRDGSLDETLSQMAEGKAIEIAAAIWNLASNLGFCLAEKRRSGAG